MTDNLTLILALASLGFFGGFSHCIGMCGPFVITQVSSRLQKTSLQNFSNFEKLRNLALLPYHLGRISTYSLIGFFCSFFTKNIQDFVGFKILSVVFLLLAIFVFIRLFLELKISAKPLIFQKIKLRFKSTILENAYNFFSKKISLLFQNPRGLKGYFLGVILGFIPCGLLYSAFMICAAISNPILAAVGMIFFGIATFPSLFLTGCASKIFHQLYLFKFIAKGLILLNVIMLIMMAIRLIF